MRNDAIGARPRRAHDACPGVVRVPPIARRATRGASRELEAGRTRECRGPRGAGGLPPPGSDLVRHRETVPPEMDGRVRSRSFAGKYTLRHKAGGVAWRSALVSRAQVTGAS